MNICIGEIDTSPNIVTIQNSNQLPIALNAALWLDAIDPSATGIQPANNSAIMTWYDKVDSNNFLQATQSKEPIFLSNDLGSPSISASSAANQYYSATQTISYGSANTIVMVASTSSSSSAYLMAGSSSGSSPAFLYGFTANTFEWYNPNPTDRFTLGTASSGYHILVVTQTDGSNITGYLDGTQAFSATPQATLNNRHLQALFTSSGSANFYNGKIKCSILFKYILSSTQLNSLSNYIHNRYHI